MAKFGEHATEKKRFLFFIYVGLVEKNTPS